MTDTADEEINRELAREIKRSLTIMLQCAADDDQLARLHTALLQNRVCGAVDALAGGESQVRRVVLTHYLRQEQNRIGSENPES